MGAGSAEYTVDLAYDQVPACIRCIHTYRIRIYNIVFSSLQSVSFLSSFSFFFKFYLQENTPGNGGELWPRQDCIVWLLGIAMEAANRVGI